MIIAHDNGKASGSDNRQERFIPPEASPVTEISPIAREVRRRMLERGLKAGHLATLAGVGPSYIYDLLKGKSRSPVFENLEKIALALGCTVADLTHPEAARDSRNQERSEGVDASSILPLHESERALIKLWRHLPKRGKDAVIAYVTNAVVAHLTGVDFASSRSDDPDID